MTPARIGMHVIAASCAGVLGLWPATAIARDAGSGAASPAGAAASGDAGWVVVGGGADDHDRDVVSTAVAAVTREVGWSLLAPASSGDPPPVAVTPQDLDQLLDCRDAARPFACVPPAIAGRGVRRLFVFAVDHKQADSGAPMIVLTARLLVASPPALVVRQRFCEQCGDDRLTDASAELARQLLQELAVRSGRTVLDVASSPPGARITLDGHPVGATNATFNTFPGSHVVIVERAGYRAETRTVITREGKTAAVSVALVAAERGADRGEHRDPPARSRWVTGALIGGGLVAAIGGGVLLDLGARGGPHDRYRYPGATPVGAVLGLAGAAALATGLYLWWRPPARGAVPSSVAAGAAGGVIAGWAAVF